MAVFRESPADSLISHRWFSDSSEVSLSSRCFRSWNSVPSPGISWCTLPTGSFSECSGQIQEPAGPGSDRLLSGPRASPFPWSTADPHCTEPGSCRHGGQSSAVHVGEWQLQNVSGFRVTHLLSLTAAALARQAGPAVINRNTWLTAFGVQNMAWESRDQRRERNRSWPQAMPKLKCVLKELPSGVNCVLKD